MAFCLEILGLADKEAAFLLPSGKACGFHGGDSLVPVVPRPPMPEHVHGTFL